MLKLFKINFSLKFYPSKISNLVLYFKSFWTEVDIPTCLSYFCWKGITNFLQKGDWVGCMKMKAGTVLNAEKQCKMNSHIHLELLSDQITSLRELLCL